MHYSVHFELIASSVYISLTLARPSLSTSTTPQRQLKKWHADVASLTKPRGVDLPSDKLPVENADVKSNSHLPAPTHRER
ncbi:hypothetical protein EVAR_72412_1 [Eumeta japonica]|uniref:Uncharacterized protein n=1 Tax=Eumeta variegata TaxID=151549 RepID=A0A4C1ST07_EUMVA|nr:hypothetical protein EVAR_72412_1 [Eumeta japonica]